MVSKRHLYDLLGVDPGATDDEIARAYRQLALKYHPDRNPEGTAKFTEMANAYCVLGDPEKRRVYNATGIAPGAEEQETNSEAASAQRAAELQERVQTFYTAYTGSQEEVDDVISIYNKCKGNFRRMVREGLLFDNGKSGEIQRLQELVRNLVDTGKVKVTEAWNATNSMKVLKQIERSLKKERTEAASALKEMGLAGGNENGDNMHALQALVKRQSGEEWSNMLSNLTERYVTKKKQVGTEQGGVGRKRKREPVEAIATPRQGRNKKK